MEEIFNIFDSSSNFLIKPLLVNLWVCIECGHIRLDRAFGLFVAIVLSNPSPSYLNLTEKKENVPAFIAMFQSFLNELKVFQARVLFREFRALMSLYLMISGYIKSI